MIFQTFGRKLKTVDLDESSRIISQRFRPLGSNKILRGMRSSFIYFNNPSFTEIKFRLYSNRFDNMPGKLIAESTAGGFTPAKFSEPYAYLQTWWRFDDVFLKQNVWYHLIPYDPTYAPDASSYLAWRKDWPDTIYTTNNEPTTVSMNRQSYETPFITAKI